ncbi:PQQ-dependent sugar dehydrogenase [Haliea sp.]|uniref:PQQ-dependent sugar dehydrogenase n=1 Tax=Haliea sp. TaxID=1932666 RepID=UPI003527E4F7
MNTVARLLLPCTLLLSFIGTSSHAQDVHYSTYHDYRVVPVVDGLVRPWSMAFLPGGDMLVTEQPGRLRIVRNGRLLEQPVSGVPEVFYKGQGGLLDVVLHPDFANNRLVYLSYAKPLADGESTTAVARGRYADGGLSEVEEIFVAQSRGRGHYGSRLAFDDQGYLFISVGDRQVPPTGDLPAHPAQQLADHHGVIVRLHDDGRVPADNPFLDRPQALPEIWSYGHRNAQGMVIDGADGTLWITEHGPQGGDELNRIQKGANYGWPVIGYGVNYGEGTTIHATTHADGMEQPVKVWVPSIGTSGLTLYAGDAFPKWRGYLLAGGLSGQELTLLRLQDGKVVHEETLARDIGRLRDVREGPDGFIYLAVDDRSAEPSAIVRLEPVPIAQRME